MKRPQAFLPARLPRLEPLIRDRLTALYRELDQEVRSLGGQCHGCGDCCRFVGYDHQLWLTNLELAYLAEVAPPNPAAVNDGVCPYLDGGRCCARAHRAVGCRVFHCNLDNDRMNPVHEQFLQKLRLLAREFDIALSYDELCAAWSAHHLFDGGETVDESVEVDLIAPGAKDVHNR